ncbi:MAG: sigma-54-dependent Fis family transcriptional regulator [Desulfuromonadaceae bacterium]|nr:sigma-54-dependent Fis family transcriptional regulator [Desulfuromonadaceae bacterium]
MPNSLIFSTHNADRLSLSTCLSSELPGPFHEADTIEQARQHLQQESCALFFCQLEGQAEPAFALLHDLARISPQTVSILLIPETTSLPLRAILQSGAHFYLHLPCGIDEIKQVIARALWQYRAQQQTAACEIPTDDFPEIIGNSLKMLNLFEMIRRLADDAESTILIHGESGTGKELVARAVHSHSPRRCNNFVPLNCAAIPDELLESELFGYEKGAFTGASHNKKGRLLHAEGGTLFLDEIGDMKPSLQAKLLRVIQEKEFEPVGSVKSIKVDVRIVAATHRNLEEAVKQGSFREDLYYRLNVIPLQIPPLRERPDDIPLLLEAFTRGFCQRKNRPLFRYAEQTLERLKNYSWPGNVRELENLVQRLSILHMEEVVNPMDLPEKYLQAGAPASVQLTVDADGTTDFNSQVSEFEDRLILQALIKTGGNKKEAAELLNLKRTTLLEKIKKKQLDKALVNMGTSSDDND